MRLTIVVVALIACGRDERIEERLVLPTEVRAPQPVRLDATVVEVGRSVLWIDHAGDRRVLVVPREPAMLVGVRAGQRIDLDGELRSLSPATIEEHAIDALDRAKLAGANVYIHAIRIATAGADHPRS